VCQAEVRRSEPIDEEREDCTEDKVNCSIGHQFEGLLRKVCVEVCRRSAQLC
jgi:hypothetical protein